MEKVSDLWEEYKNKFIFVGVCVLVLLFLLMPKIKENFLNDNGMEMQSQSEYDLTQGNNSNALSTSTQVQSSMSSSVSQAENSKSKIQVDVKGAVKNPGVITVQANQRVDGVIKKAGGIKKDADLDQVNLSHKLADQMLVYIPVKGDETQINSPVLVKNDKNDTSQVNGEETASSDTLDEGINQPDGNEKININLAPKEKLTELNGIGDKKADQIIAYRQEKGSFKTIEDLKNVSGIGDKIFESLSDQITIE
ncbi:helix-hairpin-helix domain-containing protein [Ligilactobacillus pobuzihii]|uniref:ComE operon protein 1 n=1 Tax=Ligilactobacillus pobuzihii TaxID=449659 RepID=A0A0R2LRS3_9LACO|nr:helix-hairpin-helix domain-containing protein [Ligilactobacillus pobuzihii]KRK10882.1 ComE operon protein 1 [Ligilactobacillus pobuzihii E100301 = KCTC 13174]KRO01098.1 ComE operon protein 1 [Ligilactobacillus pobuzihii]GEN47826.1 competence protein ComE [Ligilactobacillus pobuzihii]